MQQHADCGPDQQKKSRRQGQLRWCGRVRQGGQAALQLRPVGGREGVCRAAGHGLVGLPAQLSRLLRGLPPGGDGLGQSGSLSLQLGECLLVRQDVAALLQLPILLLGGG